MMTKSEKEMITDLKKCDFKEMEKYFLEKSEERKNMSKEEKLVKRCFSFAGFIIVMK